MTDLRQMIHKDQKPLLFCEIFTSILSMGLTSNHTHTNGKGGTCHGFIVIDPKVFGDADAIKEHLSTFLRELRESPKSEGAERIYTHGEKEIIATADRMKNGINVNINTVAEMFDMCKYVGLEPVDYLGDVKFDNTNESSYN